MDQKNLGDLSKANVARLDAFTDSLEATQEASKTIEGMLKANQMAASLEKLQSETEDNSAIAIQIKQKKLDRKKEVKTDKAKHAKKSVLVRKDEADGLTDGFSKRQGNREYRLDVQLFSQLAEDVGIALHEGTETDEMILHVQNRLMVDNKKPDVSIIDKAFEFLIEVTKFQITQSKGEATKRLENILNKIESAKMKHFESHKVEIEVAQKIIGAVDAVAETTGQSVPETLERYRGIVHTPPDIQTMRKYYEEKGFKAMVLELKGLSSYLGGNFKRTNLEGPELGQLAAAARKMQALLGVHRVAKINISTLESFLKMNGVLDSAAAA